MDLQLPRTSMTRRAALTRAGIVTGSALVAASGWNRLLTRAFGAPGAALAARRRNKTYRALVDTVASSPANTLTAASAEKASTGYARWYAAQSPRAQRIADSILDDLDALSARAPFRKVEGAGRLQQLRRATHAHGRRSDAAAADAAAKWSVNERRSAETARAARRDRSDPKRIETAIPVRRDSGDPSPRPHNPTREEIARTSLAVDALALALAPLYPNEDQAGLMKVSPVSV